MWEHDCSRCFWQQALARVAHSPLTRCLRMHTRATLRPPAGTRGSLLRAPTPLASEKHVDILGQVRVVLEQRRSALGAISCPVGLVTDDILRDEFGLKALLTSVFPEVMADPTRACLIVQDVVHRR